MIYYNTTHLSGDALKHAVAAAARQDQAILLLFENCGRPFSPSQVYRLMQKAGHNWPITSVRRAITNLEQAGRLTKTGDLIIGLFGRPENTWIKTK